MGHGETQRLQVYEKRNARIGHDQSSRFLDFQKVTGISELLQS